MAIYPIVNETFHSKPQKVRGSTKNIRNHPLETISIYSKFNGNPSNSRYILLYQSGEPTDPTDIAILRLTCYQSMLYVI